MDRLPPPGSQHAVWLVTVDVAGQPLRLASQPVEVTEARTGTIHVYAEALVTIDVSEPTGSAGEDSAGVSIPVSATLADPPAALAADGHVLLFAPAEVAFWVEGTDYSERRVVVRGHCVNIEWGSAGEPIAFSVESKLWDDPTLIPTPTQQVDGTTWGDHALTLQTQWLGLPYPIIIGRPGVVSTTIQADGRVTGSRMLWTACNPIYDGTAGYYEVIGVVAGHHVEATRALIFTDDDPDTGARIRIQNLYDALGQPVAVANWYAYTSGTAPANSYDHDGATTYHYAETESDGNSAYGLGSPVITAAINTADQVQVYVSWLDEIDGAGGLVWRGELLRNGADILEWAASQTGQTVDVASFRAVRAGVSAFLFDGTIDARVSPWEWAKQNILPYLPITLDVGAEGIRPYLRRSAVGVPVASLRLDADTDPRIARSSTIRADHTRIVNRATLKYAYSIRLGTYCGTMTIGPDTTTDLTSAYARESASRYRFPNGRPYIVEEQYEATCIYSDATAAAFLEMVMRDNALARRTVSYIVPTDYAPGIAHGVIVSLTDSLVSLSDALAEVLDVRWTANGDGADVTLRLLDDPSAFWG